MEAFKAYDSDGSGQIDCNELCAALRRLGVDASPGQARDMIKPDILNPKP